MFSYNVLNSHGFTWKHLPVQQLMTRMCMHAPFTDEVSRSHQHMILKPDLKLNSRECTGLATCKGALADKGLAIGREGRYGDAMGRLRLRQARPGGECERWRPAAGLHAILLAPDPARNKHSVLQARERLYLFWKHSTQVAPN